ncbi:MAG TPA: cobalt ECF transporter T component CbiQ [Desulfobacterales bacterium]|jgi:cobalt/nickel transport system permease protein|nr:cobalt ECF transporter T component CbiQ [Desulfobacterales bacterium]
MLREPFAVGDSAVHRLDPRIRIASAVIYSCATALCRELPALLAALALSAGLVAIARLRTAEVLKRLLVVNGLVLFIWVVVPFTFPGETLVRIGPLGAAREGVELATQITLKSNAIVLALIALVATMPFATVGHALHRLRVPDKIVHLLLMTYRYIFVLEQEYLRLARAAAIRGFRPGTNLHTYRTYAYLVGMLFVKAIDRAERVRWAMLCRGFKRKFYSLHEFKAGRGSVIFLIFISAAVLGIAALELGAVAW